MRKKLITLLLMITMMVCSVSVAYANEDAVIPGTYETEYGYRYVSQETVGADTITMIVDVYNPGTNEEYTISGVYGMNGYAVYNSNTKEMTENGVTTEVELVEYYGSPSNFEVNNMVVLNGNGTRPTTIDHPFKFKKPDWGYITSTWVKVTSESLINDLGTYGIMALINAACPPLGVIADIAIILSNHFSKPANLNENAFWLRRYIYGYAYVLNQTKVLAHQYYEEDYDEIDGAWECVQSALE